MISSVRDNCQAHIDKCIEKVKHHQKNSTSAKHWDNFLSFNNLLLSASTALTMTILTSFSASAVTVTIIGAIYAFLLTINNKIRDEYHFLALYYQHINSLDSFGELEIIFRDLVSKIDTGHIITRDELQTAVAKFESVKQKSHVQTVKECKFFCCLRN